MTFKKLVRYEHGGQAHYGDLEGEDDAGYTVRPLSGSLEEGFRATNEESIKVEKLLCPLEKIPIALCVGLNYRKHATEANLPVPLYPVIFTKPADALAGPHDDIHIHPACQGQLDYEGELTVVMGRDCKDASEDSALDYVLGYTAGNDVSARNFQLPDASGGQFCYAKSFDGFAPIGPAIWAMEAAGGDPQRLHYVTRVNGEERQRTGTDDMIWSVAQIVAHLSRGTTLRAGTIIMTGTPAGVGLFQKRFLRDGDVVEVEVEGLGKIRNRIVFDKE